MSARPAGCGEDIAAYALGALEPEQARHFERHLRECDLCRTDLAALRPAVEALPASAEAVEPPPELRKRIMSIVEAEAKERRRAEAPSRAPRFSFRAMPALAAAACAVAIAAVVVTRDGSETESLRAAVNPPGAAAQLRVDDGRGTLVVEGMPAPPSGRVYQVWRQRGEEAPQPTNALFTPARDGSASVAVPGGLEGVDRVLVSHEPPGGSRRPSSAAAIVIET